MTYLALHGGEIVAVIYQLPYSYLLAFPDGRTTYAASLDDIRAAGYDIRIYRPETSRQTMSRPDWGDRQETPGHQTPDLGAG